MFRHLFQPFHIAGQRIPGNADGSPDMLEIQGDLSIFIQMYFGQVFGGPMAFFHLQHFQHMNYLIQFFTLVGICF